MGLWLNDRQIQRIVARLDFKFSDSGPNSGIRKIRNSDRIDRFDPGTTGPGLALHKIARRMRIWGDLRGPGSRHSKRWWGFLKALHSKANNAPSGGGDAAEDIKKFIKAALEATNDCVAIKFSAVKGTDLRVVSNAIPLPEDRSKYIALIILQTPKTDGTEAGDPGNDGEDPEDEDSFTAMEGGISEVAAGRPAQKKAAKKKAVKKTVAKKKAAKKKTAKKKS